MSKNTYPFVMVCWEDSLQPDPSWELIEHVKDPSPEPCISLGYIVKQNDGAILLAQSVGIGPDGDITQVNGCMVIVRSAIKSIQRVEAVRGSGGGRGRRRSAGTGRRSTPPGGPPDAQRDPGPDRTGLGPAIPPSQRGI